jgi:hypothetical protein
LEKNVTNNVNIYLLEKSGLENKGKDNGDVVRTCVEFAGRFVYVIKNDFEKSDYLENIPGCQMLVKAKSSHYQIVDTLEQAYSQTVELLVPCQNALVQKCMAEGTQCQKNNEICHWQFSHDGGAVFVYKNSSKSNTLEEKIAFDLKNLRIDG